MWTAEWDYTHTFGLPTGGSIDVNGGGRYSAADWLTVDFIPAERAPAFTMWNASVSYRDPSKHWVVDAYVRNISNAVEYTSAQLQTQAPPLVAATISPPRTYGIQVHIVNW